MEAPKTSFSSLTFPHRKYGRSDLGTDQQNRQWVMWLLGVASLSSEFPAGWVRVSSERGQCRMKGPVGNRVYRRMLPNQGRSARARHRSTPSLRPAAPRPHSGSLSIQLLAALPACLPPMSARGREPVAHPYLCGHC